MEEFKGTPGPWYQDQFGNVLHGDKKDTVRVSGVSLPGRVTEEYAANTNLVTAAPELLEALQKLRDYAEDVCGVCPDDCHKEHPLMLASSAIAKALGK